MAEKSWPHWNSFPHIRRDTVLFYYPWLKSRGPIETFRRPNNQLSQSQLSMAEKSWPHWNFSFPFSLSSFSNAIHGWKVVAPLKLGYSYLGHIPWYPVYPWLKSRGPIETESLPQASRNWDNLSMAEKSWPHWNSADFFCYMREEFSLSMAEKSWPHWNYIFQQYWSRDRKSPSIHGWKVVAPVETSRW